MDIEDFIKLGERIRMREELASNNLNKPFIASKVKSNGLSEEDANFIQKEFQKEVLERDWSRLYSILSHLKSLSNSLVVHEIKI